MKRKWTVVAEGGDEAGAGGKRLAEGTARREPEQRLPVVAGMATEAAALAGGDATGGQGGPEKVKKAGCAWGLLGNCSLVVRLLLPGRRGRASEPERQAGKLA